MLRVATFKLESTVAKASFLPVSCLPKINSRKNQDFSRFTFIFKSFHGLEKLFLNSSTFQGFQGLCEPCGHVLASPPGHSPKAERWPGTDCLRMLQNYTKTGVISKTPCTFREFDSRTFRYYVRSNLHQQ